MIQNSAQLGLISLDAVNSTYVINPDEFVNFNGQVLTGARLGHDDRFATSSSQIINGGTTRTTWTTNDIVHGGTAWSTGTSGWTMGPNAIRADNQAIRAAGSDSWTTESDSWSTASVSGGSFIWNGQMLTVPRLEKIVINGRQVYGLYINDSFIEGNFISRNGILEFVGGKYEMINGQYTFVEGQTDNLGNFVTGTWTSGVFKQD